MPHIFLRRCKKRWRVGWDCGGECNMQQLEARLHNTRVS